MRKTPRLRWLVLLLLLCYQASTTARATQEQIAAAETRKLLADRAWFSQIARVQQHTDDHVGDGRGGGGAVQEGRASSSCSPDDAAACLVVTELLQPGATVGGYELVERTALLGVCDQQPRSGGSPPAQIAHEQQQHARGGQIDTAEVVASNDDEALELALPVQNVNKQGEDEESDSSAETASEEGDSSGSIDGANSVCAVPITLGGSDATGTQVAQTAASYEKQVDGPALEYQCLLEDHIDLIYVNANYRLRRKFDAGSHGEVWKATRRSSASGREEQFILKRLFLELGEQMVQMGLREAHFGRVLAKEPHVTRFVEYFFRPSAQTDGDEDNSDEIPTTAAGPAQQELWLVFYDEGISLRHYLYAKREATHSGVIFEPSAFWKKLRTDANGEIVFREILRQLLQGVAALHARGITHRDIKPSNILVSIKESSQPHQSSGVPTVKLADFGSAVDDFTLRHLYPSGHGPSQAEETREYQPPEVLFNDLGQPYDYENPFSYDLWSVGVVFLEMLLGSPQVFMISPRARAKLDAALRSKHKAKPKPTSEQEDQQTKLKSYLLHVLSHEFCIFQPPPHQLRALWATYAVSSDGCNFGKFNLTIVERDPLRKGLENPWGLDLMWKLLQWHPSQRIPAAQALEHAFFKGAYRCEKSGRAFATKQELAVHEAYLKVQEARDNEMALAVREKYELPSAFTCPHCGRSFSTVASCEQHLVARRHNTAAQTHFCNFDALLLQQAVGAETKAYQAAQQHDLPGSLFDSSRTVVGVALFQGRKKFMEDFLLVDSNPQLGFDLYAVADGHLGMRAAAYAIENLLRIVSSNFALLPATTTSTIAEREFAEQVALRQTFLELHSGFMRSIATSSSSSEHGDSDFSGCTLTVVLHFREEQRLVSANVGDSRAIALLRRKHSPDDANGDATTEQIVPLSVDHCPNAPEERARIESSGGFVSFAGLWRVVGQLAVSRSIGDQHLRQYVSAEPSVFHTSLVEFDDHHGGGVLVVASDGLWEAMTNEDALRFVRERQRKKRNATLDLGEMARDLVIEGYVRGSQDNLAVILVELG
ncbi:hypothetical protein Gpo141_00009934 [Globisporangium polare]